MNVGKLICKLKKRSLTLNIIKNNQKVMNLNFLKTILIFSLLISGFHSNAQEMTIIEWELPRTARDFITVNFPEQKIKSAVKEDKQKIREYEVMLDNNVKIEFDDLGYWKEVDGKNSSIPTKFIPIKIMEYINDKYPSEKVNKIEKNSTQYEIELMNGTELEFNLKGKFLRIDND